MSLPLLETEKHLWVLKWYLFFRVRCGLILDLRGSFPSGLIEGNSWNLYFCCLLFLSLFLSLSVIGNIAY